jgi:glucose/arabinose dehydrogenase
MLPAGVGEVNALAVAPDGSLVLGISAPCDACDPAQPFAGAVIGFAPDGTGAHVIASGLRAPVGLAYVPGTSTLLASENQRDDLGDATPGDWLIGIEAGQDWGFPACYGQDDAACADSPAPVATLDAHAAASGVAVVRGDTAVVAEWAKGAVLGVGLSTGGSGVTATSAPQTYIAGLSQPVGLLTVGDALYVGDWGSGTVYRVTGG